MNEHYKECRRFFINFVPNWIKSFNFARFSFKTNPGGGQIPGG